MTKKKCDVCHQRRGKRVCPARDGASICPQCCAANRVTRFPCPPHCPFLGSDGSLRLVAQRKDAFVPPSPEALLAFLATLGKSVGTISFLERAEPAALMPIETILRLDQRIGQESRLDLAIFDWVVFGGRDLEGQPLVNYLVTRLPRPLTSPEQDALRALHRSSYRLLRVEAALQDDQVRTHDMLANADVIVSQPGLAKRFSTGQVLGTHVTPTTHGFILPTGQVLLPNGSEEKLIARLIELQEASPLSEVPLQEFVTRVSLLVLLLVQEWLDASATDNQDFRDEPPPFL